MRLSHSLPSILCRPWLAADSLSIGGSRQHAIEHRCHFDLVLHQSQLDLQDLRVRKSDTVAEREHSRDVASSEHERGTSRKRDSGPVDYDVRATTWIRPVELHCPVGKNEFPSIIKIQP